MKRTGTPISRGCPGDPETPLINAYLAVSEVLANYHPPAQVARETSRESYAPGDTVEVTLRVIAEAPGADISVTELLPELMEPREISHQGLQAGNTIEWLLSGVQNANLSYRITPPPCAGDLSFGAGVFYVG